MSPHYGDRHIYMNGAWPVKSNSFVSSRGKRDFAARARATLDARVVGRFP